MKIKVDKNKTEFGNKVEILLEKTLFFLKNMLQENNVTSSTNRKTILILHTNKEKEILHILQQHNTMGSGVIFTISHIQ